MNQRERRNADAWFISTVLELTDVNPYHGLLREEVLTEILLSLDELKHPARLNEEPEDLAREVVSMYWDDDWDGDEYAEQKYEWALESAREVLRCYSAC